MKIYTGNIVFKKVDTSLYAPEYLKDREKVWDKKRETCLSTNTPLWNGVVYYLDSNVDGVVQIGLCEYKDLVFLEEKEVSEIKEMYGMDFNFVYMNVQILIKDTDDTYLFGFKKHNSLFEIISVGGTLRLEDGNDVEVFKDVVAYAEKEMSIETKIKVDPDRLLYKGIVEESGICTFLFEYGLKPLDENLLNIGEFDGGIILAKHELFNTANIKPNKRLMALRKYF